VDGGRSGQEWSVMLARRQGVCPCVLGPNKSCELRARGHWNHAAQHKLCTKVWRARVLVTACLSSEV